MTPRAEARARGLSRYISDKPCFRGHHCERLVGNGKCLECNVIDARLWRARNRTLDRVRNRARYAADPQKKRDDVAAWKIKNPERCAALYRDWAKKNPDKVRAKTAKRRARKVAAEGFFCDDDLDRIFKAQRGLCAFPWCRGKLKGHPYHADHIIALSKGGTNWPSNIQLVHDICNLRKGAKDPIDHAREHGLLV